jgi:hypothetical protein
MTRVIHMVPAMLIAVSTTSAAQSASDSGQRVRITRTTGMKAIGVLRQVSDQSLTIRRTPWSLDEVIERSDVQRVERSLGTRRDFGGGFRLGFLASVGVGLLAGLNWQTCGDGCIPDSRSQALAVAAIGGVVIGVPVGIVVGALRHVERWTTIAASGSDSPGIRFSADVGATPGAGGFVRLALRR